MRELIYTLDLKKTTTENKTPLLVLGNGCRCPVPQLCRIPGLLMEGILITFFFFLMGSFWQLVQLFRAFVRLYVSQSVLPSVYYFINPSIRPSVYSSVQLSFHWTISALIHLSVYPFIPAVWPFIRSSTYPSPGHPSIHQFVLSFIRPPFNPSNSLSIHQSISQSRPPSLQLSIPPPHHLSVHCSFIHLSIHPSSWPSIR